MSDGEELESRRQLRPARLPLGSGRVEVKQTPQLGLVVDAGLRARAVLVQRGKHAAGGQGGRRRGSGRRQRGDAVRGAKRDSPQLASIPACGGILAPTRRRAQTARRQAAMGFQPFQRRRTEPASRLSAAPKPTQSRGRAIGSLTREVNGCREVNRASICVSPVHHQAFPLARPRGPVALAPFFTPPAAATTPRMTWRPSRCLSVRRLRRRLSSGQ